MSGIKWRSWCILVCALAAVIVGIQVCQYRSNVLKASGPIIVAESGQIPAGERELVSSAVKVAKEYVYAWVNRDYRKMISLTSNSSIFSCHGKYEAAKRMHTKWREIGVRRDFKITKIPDAESLEKSMMVLGGVSGMQAEILLCIAVGNSGTLDKMESGTWPACVIFLKHSISGRDCMMILVKDYPESEWKVMNDPGTLDIRRHLKGSLNMRPLPVSF